MSNKLKNSLSKLGPGTNELESDMELIIIDSMSNSKEMDKLMLL
jgi:hypothetical protein